MYKNEQELGEAMLAKERQHSLTFVDGKALRPKLPCDTKYTPSKINNQQRRILGFIKKNGPSTSADIAEKLHLNRISVSSHLSNMAMASAPLIKKMFAIRVPVKGKQKNGNKTKQLWVYGIPASAKSVV